MLLVNDMFNMMRPNLMVISDKVYNEYRMKNYKNKLESLKEMRDHYINEIKQVEEDIASVKKEIK